MKRLTTIVLVLMLLLGTMTNVSAANGDVINYAKYTDIKAYINHYLIESYNIDGYTAIVANDLMYFGFDVVWDQDTRSLSITRNPNVTNVTNYNNVPYEVHPDNIGKVSYPVLETDIKTYVNGVQVKSYNINGKTLIDFDALSVYGGFSWSQEFRVIKLWIQDGLNMLSYEQQPRSLPRVTLYSADGRTVSVYEHEKDAYLAVGWYSTRAEAENVRTSSANKQAVGKFRVGQNVRQNLIFMIKYGTVKEIDASTGKVKVYWYKILDSNGEKMTGTTAIMFYGLESSVWVNASDISPLN